jgi:hypothetical protein
MFFYCSFIRVSSDIYKKLQIGSVFFDALTIMKKIAQKIDFWGLFRYGAGRWWVRFVIFLFSPYLLLWLHHGGGKWAKMS